MTPVRPWPLVERSSACRAVLVAESGWARHVVVRHHWRLNRLQRLVGSVTPNSNKDKMQHMNKIVFAEYIKCFISQRDLIL